MQVVESIIGPMWEADLMTRLAESGVGVGDSIASIMPENSVSALEMFGPQSTLASVHNFPAAEYVTFLCDNPVYQLIVLGCFLVYCMLLYYFRGHVYALLSTAGSKLFEEKLLDDQSYTFTLFLNYVIGFGCLVGGVIVVKYIDMAMGYDVAASLPPWSVHLLAVAVTLAIGIIALYQRLVLILIGNVTYSTPFTDRLRYLKKIILSLFIIVASPVVMMLSLNASAAQEVVSYIFLGLFAALLAMFVYKTYLLFIEQNVSILHWFLYLCTVEIFPVSIFVLIVLKNT